MFYKRGGVLLVLCGCLVVGFALITRASAFASPPEQVLQPTPIDDKAELPQGMQPITITDRLAEPYMPPKPSQADLGARVYWQVCMACHGDKGQGLTEEWREQFGPEDMDCWQSGCHDNDHPPEGFRLVEYVPPVFGPGTLSRFKNAQDLYDYLVETMPWWNPGYLQPEEYWQVTAFMLRQRGVLPNEVTLNEGNASVFLLRPASPLPEDPKPGALAVAGAILTAAVLIVIQRKNNGS